MVGAYAGNRLGAIRDAKGKSVAAVFAQLGGSQKAEVCHLSSAIGKKVFLKTTFTLLRSYALLPPRSSVQPLVSSDDTPLSVLYDV